MVPKTSRVMLAGELGWVWGTGFNDVERAVGLEALVGIPGSLGGGIIMNAGAEGTEIGKSIETLTRITNDGRIQTLKRQDLVLLTTFTRRRPLFSRWYPPFAR